MLRFHKMQSFSLFVCLFVCFIFSFFPFFFFLCFSLSYFSGFTQTREYQDIHIPHGTFSLMVLKLINYWVFINEHSCQYKESPTSVIYSAVFSAKAPLLDETVKSVKNEMLVTAVWNLAKPQIEQKLNISECTSDYKTTNNGLLFISVFIPVRLLLVPLVFLFSNPIPSSPIPTQCFTIW